MIRQTLALFLDSYRELASKKMFWIVLILSGAAVGVFALVGVTPAGVTIAGYDLPVPIASGESVYKLLFADLMIGLWLTWAAMILALVSTASVFPDFVAGGSIDLYLSKPISRVRLYLTKFAAGLLFVALQVTVFSALSFVLFRLRAGIWEPRLFLAIPIVLLFFSYLFSVQALFGVWTRSTIASLLLALLVWLVAFGAHFAETQLAAFKTVYEDKRAAWLAKGDLLEKQVADLLARQPGLPPDNPVLQANRSARDQVRAWAADAEPTIAKLTMWHRLTGSIAAVVPKTSETANLLKRNLLSRDDMDVLLDNMPRRGNRRPAPRVDEGREVNRNDVARAQVDIEWDRSLARVIGSSLAFEAVMLGLGAWIFARRDY